MRKLGAALAAVVLLMGCGRWGSHSQRAVAQAIDEHLKQNSHLIASSFDTEVERVTFNGDSADAVVKFKSKQSAAIFVEVRYGLHYENGRWEVVSSQAMSGQDGDSHGQTGAGTPPPSTGATPAAAPLQPSH